MLRVQVVDVTFPMMGMPEWAGRLVLALLAVGLIVGFVLAWTFDATASGVVRTPAADARSSDAAPTRAEPASADRTHSGISVGDEDATERPAAPQGGFSPLAIAVLPFTNLSDDPENEYFSDGITEDILTHLSRIEDLHVVSRTSVMGYKGTKKQMREIASACPRS